MKYKKTEIVNKNKKHIMIDIYIYNCIYLYAQLRSHISNYAALRLTEIVFVVTCWQISNLTANMRILIPLIIMG